MKVVIEGDAIVEVEGDLVVGTVILYQSDTMIIVKVATMIYMRPYRTFTCLYPWRQLHD